MADHIHEGDMDVVRCPQCSPGLVETETFRTTYKRRECCDSTEAQWHSRPCAVDGDQGPVGMNDWPPHEKLFAITNPEPPSHMYFAQGQAVIKSDSAWVFGPTRVWSSSAGLRIREDTVASDRTFENETKLHKRSPIHRDDWLF